MRDNKTGLFKIGMADSLWHMKLNANLRHIDENMIGQAVRLPVHPDGADLFRAVHFENGMAKNGYSADGVHGVVLAIEDDMAMVQTAGYALMTVTAPVINEFAYVAHDGTGIAVSQANMETGAYDPKRIVGAIVDVKATRTGVMIGAKGMWEAVVSSPGFAADGFFASTGQLQGQALVSAAAIKRDGVVLRGSNISGATVSGNTMTITFQRPYVGNPDVQVGQVFTTPVRIENHSFAGSVVLTCFALDGSPKNFSTLTGEVHIFATGVSS